MSLLPIVSVWHDLGRFVEAQCQTTEYDTNGTKRHSQGCDSRRQPRMKERVECPGGYRNG